MNIHLMHDPLLIASSFPAGSVRGQRRLVGNAAVETLTHYHADFDLDHVEPASVSRREVELNSVENPPSFLGDEGLV